MEDSQPKEVLRYCESDSETRTPSPQWKPFLRQLLVCSGTWSSLFLYGLVIGAPTVMIPQIRKEANSTTIITDEMASWLTSMYGFSGFLFVVIVSIIARLAGRKISFTMAVAVSLGACVLLYFSSKLIHVFIFTFMQGIFSASQTVIISMIVTEYTSPKYRGIFLTIKAATVFWGIWVSNAIGTFFHWRMIPLFGIPCAVYSLLTVTIWPESPCWLASKGKYKECAASHRWLKGFDVQSEKELEELIKVQKTYIDTQSNGKITIKERLRDFYTTIKSKEFLKPTVLAMTTGSISIISGKLMCAMYAIDILKKITGNESSAYVGMLILDGVTVFSMYMGCILAKYCKRRPYLLVSSTISILFLFILSSYLYLVKLEIIEENKYMSMTILTGYSIAISCGPLIISTSVGSELIPIRSRNLSMCLIALFVKLVIAATLKTAPFLFKVIGLHGVFFIYALVSLIIILILYIYLPETKDRTLQEINDSMSK